MQRHLKIFATPEAAHDAWVAASALASEPTDKKFTDMLGDSRNRSATIITRKGRVQTEFWCVVDAFDRARLSHLPWDTKTVEDDCTQDVKDFAVTIQLRGT